MGVDWQFLPFPKLTLDQLYDLLRLREQIFVIEQTCLYGELDGWEKEAFHLLGYAPDKTLAAYARIFPPNHVYYGETFPEARIGRVALHKDWRGKGRGHMLMQESLARVESAFGKTPVILNAQTHLEKFYNAHGFSRAGDIFDEGGIPHILMRRPE